ncbi:response regulator transcription factor [Pseudoflavitalea sp. X16]|uniref:LytR/AlgR family response regulator transcription factor n=1 Tax=Paraflavitalea devenefica TaxID=2716334 RepID=UPI0014225BE9|nr:LytTR family DNA-binding domain-containing protein [Paraflavitalea devenefica]NII26389.1 response regulator transcription factor [Paraflavitalea devenefica]
MERIRCMIVDDEPLPLELLEDYIRKTPFLELAGAFTNPLEALALATQQPPQLIFLDIQMAELNGVQFTQLLNKKSKVIFTTAYPQYAIQGFELEVVDYLLKPVSFERFLKSAGKARELIALENRPGIPEVATRSAPEEILFVKSGHKIIKVAIPDILYIEGLKEYIAIHTLQGKTIALQTFKRTAEVLPPGRFVRVHKSFLVAFDKIESIERNQVLVRGRNIPVGDTYREAFFSLLRQKNLL